MPTYEFVCRRCDRRFSLFTTVAGRSKVSCPSCQSNDLRQVFKGMVFLKSSSRSDGGSSSVGSGCPRTSCSGCSGC